jgi:hypothetical protein
LRLDPEEDRGESEKYGAGEEEYAAEGSSVQMQDKQVSGIESETYTTACRPAAPPQPINTMEKVKVEVTNLPGVQHHVTPVCDEQLTPESPRVSH